MKEYVKPTYVYVDLTEEERFSGSCGPIALLPGQRTAS
jgi:hypothetical protein